jgi:hypothetical protein
MQAETTWEENMPHAVTDDGVRLYYESGSQEFESLRARHGFSKPQKYLKE